MSSRRLSVSVPLPVVAAAALLLVVALLGATSVGYAAGKVKGDSVLKKHSVSGNRLKADTVTGDQVAEGTLGTVPSAARAGVADTVAAPTFHTFAFEGGWSDAQGNAGYWLDASGFVHLQGNVMGGTAGVFATLPAGFRASPYTTLSATNISTGAGVIVITNGTGILQSTAAATISLTGITFHADK